MDQVFRKPITRHWSHIEGTSQRNRLRWSLLVALSSRLFIALFLIGLGMFGLVASVEQATWLGRQAEDTVQFSAAVQNHIQHTWNQLTLVEQPGALDQHQALEQLRRVDPSWQEVASWNSQGNVLDSAFAEQPLLQEAALDGTAAWFQQAADGSPALAVMDGMEGLILAIPTVKGGVTAGRISTGTLVDWITPLTFGKSGFSYILNRADGSLIALPEGKTAQPSLYQKIVRRPGEAWNGQLNNPAGKMVQIATAPIPGTGWVLVTEALYSEITSTGHLIWQVNIAWLLLLWLLSSLTCAALLNRYVIHPLLSLRQGIERIQRGERSYRIPVSRDDEIGDTARQINELGASLEEREHRLDKAREKAVLDSQFKSELLKRVDHNLRQPLGAILGFSEMLRDEILGPTTSQQRRAIGDMINNSQRMSHMITNLVDSASLETQALHLREEEFSPAQLLGQISSQMEPRAESKGLTLTSELDPRLPGMLRGDVVRLQHVIICLVDNAIKFTQWGSVYIYFARASASQWTITVTDTGAGIPAEACAAIFEPFMQIQPPSARDIGGVGMGLSIVQQLVERMHGQVRVESTVGIGSTFTITLPIHPKEVEKEGQSC